jgi:2-keto-3-deoxy-L-rhamnonate aldolase RhmA
MVNYSTTDDRLELFLFTTDLTCALQAQEAGIDSVIVDWEWRGKQHRQAGYSTEINADTPEDVAALAARLRIPVTVRVDRLQENTASDVEIALDHGAGAIMLPMAEQASDVKRFARLVRGRARTIIQIETESLVRQCDALRSVDWDCAYIGLNDLMVSRGTRWIWEPLADGTVERIFDILGDRALGFGGVTVVGGGRPLPFVELLREMARLGCRLSFLRRTFKAEILDRDISAEVAAVRATWTAARRRGPQAVQQDRAQFRQRLLNTRPLPLSEDCLSAEARA